MIEEEAGGTESVEININISYIANSYSVHSLVTYESFKVPLPSQQR